VTPGSSLLLSWENPAEIWHTDVREVRLTRTVSTLNGVLIRDVPWGVYEDLECRDPTAHYSAAYISSTGSVLASVPNQDIRRTLRPHEICKIVFEFYTMEALPWRNRTIMVESMAASEGAFRRRLVTNGKGLANIFLMPGSHVRILPDGDPNAVELVVPDQREINWLDLAPLGSKALVDPRSSIGVF